MTRRCNHCQAENSVADDAATASTAPMCMRCGKVMQLDAAPSPGAAAAAPPATADASAPPPVVAADDFDGSSSTIMVQRPKLPTASTPARTARVEGRATAPAGDDEAWHVVVDGAQQGPLTSLDLARLFQQQKVGEASLLWRSGMAAWTRLENLPEVLAGLRAAPPVAADDGAAKALLHLVEEEVHKAAPVAASSAPAAAPSAPQATKAAGAVTGAPAAAMPSPAGRVKTVPVDLPRRRLYWVAGLAVAAGVAAVGWVLSQNRTEASMTAAATPASAAPPAAGAGTENAGGEGTPAPTAASHVAPGAPAAAPVAPAAGPPAAAEGSAAQGQPAGKAAADEARDTHEAKDGDKAEASTPPAHERARERHRAHHGRRQGRSHHRRHHADD